MLTNKIFKDTLYPLLKNNKRGFVIIFCFSLLISLSGVVQPLIMQHIIDDAIIASNMHELYFFVILSFVLTIAMIILSSINEIFYTSNSMHILFKFRELILNKLFLHNKKFLVKYHSADLMSRVQADLSEIQRFYTDSVLAVFSTIISLVFISVILYSYNIKLMILILIFLPIEFFCLKPLYPYVHDSTKQMRESTTFLGKFFIEKFRYMLVLKNLGAQDQIINSLHTTQSEYKKVIIRNKKINIIFSQIPSLISLIGKTIIISYGGYLTIQGELKIGELIAFLTYFGMILAPVHTILGVINNLPKVKVSLSRVEEILPKEEKLKEINFDNYEVHIKNISFNYDKNIIFKNLNLLIKENQKIAIIGKNGAGKSTLGDLICGLDSSCLGDIFIGNNLIGKDNYLNFHKYIVKLEQTPVLFDDTLKANLLLANPNATDSELLSALEKTGMKEWFLSLKDGLNTNIYEEGSNISGGQKQRIALSRIILLNPKIIILDEFTSSIDQNDAQWFFQNISKIFEKSTVIAITHHLDMLKDFHKIYLLKEKKLQEYTDEL